MWKTFVQFSQKVFHILKIFPRVELWKCENVEKFFTYGNVEMWKTFPRVEMWKCGNVENIKI